MISIILIIVKPILNSVNINTHDFNPVLFQNKVLQSKNNEIIHLSIGNDINLKSESIIDLNKKTIYESV